MDGCWLITATAKIVKNRLWLIFDNFGIVLFVYPWKTFFIGFVVTDFLWINFSFLSRKPVSKQDNFWKKRDQFYALSIRLFKPVTRSITNSGQKYSCQLCSGLKKIFCMRKLQGISGQAKGYKSAVPGVKKIFVSSLRGYLVVLLHVTLNSVVLWGIIFKKMMPHNISLNTIGKVWYYLP